jgi:8-oxo-dGTP diphosphatase
MGSVKEPTSGPGRPAVAVAIVISHLGVLVGRRRDGKPPWVFPGGKIEPGESPEEAAVRETLEETGLRVRATRVIGSRVHPVTGVRIVYVAAVPPGEADAVAAGDELAEVRWVSPAEAEELMPGMYEPVRQFLTEGEPGSGPGTLNPHSRGIGPAGESASNHAPPVTLR